MDRFYKLRNSRLRLRIPEKIATDHKDGILPVLFESSCQHCSFQSAGWRRERRREVEKRLAEEMRQLF